MTIITIKINERTKAGKAFMAMTDFFRDSKAIEIVEPETTKAPNKLMRDLEQSFKEVKLAQQGKLKLKSLDQLLNEK